jgi:peptide/nickel transport system substrate-binding protein
MSIALNRRRFLAASTLAAAAPALRPATSRAQDNKNVLRIALGGFPTQKGNAYANIQTPSIIIKSALFDGLTRLKPDGNVVPALASSWAQRDPLTWRFNLRRDIVFSNGKPFTAEAVVWAVTYMVNPGPAIEQVRRDMTFLAGAKAIDKHTVDITTKIPMPLLPRNLAVLFMVDPEAWNRMGVEAFMENPVGTGPMTAESWDPGRISLRANTTSWRKPSIDGVEYLLVADVPARIQAMLSGRLDVVYQLPPEDFQLVKDAGGTILTITDGAAMSVNFTFGPSYQGGRQTPLNDVRVRRALNMAVDRQTIIDVLLGGRTQLSAQPAVPAAYGYDPSITPYPYDPAAAKKLLAEAGYPNGFSVTFATSGGGVNSFLIVQRIADDLARVGIKVEVRTKPSTQYLLDFVQGRYDTDLFTLQFGSYPSLDAIQMTTTGSCRKTNPWYCDREIQPVIDAAWSEPDPAKGLELRRQVMRHYHDQAPAIFMHDNVAFIGLSPRTSGYDNAFGSIAYENVRLKL